MEVRVEGHWLGPAPGLVGRAEDPRGTVVLLHGLFGHALGNLEELRLLRRAGWNAVGIDAPGHGRRHDQALGDGWESDRMGTLARGVQSGAAEIPAVVDALDALGLRAPFALVGISYGAYTLWPALALEPRIGVACALLGSPEVDGAPTVALPTLSDRAILAINAGADEVVPLGPTREAIATLQAHEPGRHQVVELLGAMHAVPERDWWLAWGRVLGWLDRFMA